MAGTVFGRLTSPIDSFRLPVEAGREDPFLCQSVRDLLNAHSIQAHTVNLPYHRGGGFLYHPPFGVFRVLLVPVGRLAHRLTGVPFDLVADPPLFADVSGVPLIEQVLLGKGTKSFEKARIYAGLRWIGS